MTTNNLAIQEIPTIGKDNSAIIDALTKAKKVAVTLGHQGFKVLDISVGTRNPRIIINPSPRCKSLDGAEIKREKLSAAVIITMSASIDGVQVEWMIPHA